MTDATSTAAAATVAEARSPSTDLTVPRFQAMVLLALALAVALVLLANAFPYFKDSGELSSSLATSGLAHPTGFPLQHVGAAVARLLPIGSVSLRLSLLSVLGAVIAAGAGLGLSLAGRVPQERKHRSVALFAAAGVWAGFALCDTIYLHSVNVEVYLPSVALSAMALLAAWRAVAAPMRLDAGADAVDRRWWRVLWLCAGLSLGAHITAVGVAGLACLVSSATLVLRARKGGNPRAVAGLFGQGVLLALCGALVLLYLPVRSSVGPVRLWADASSLAGFVGHVTGRSIRTAFEGSMLSGSLPAIGDRWMLYFESIAGQSMMLLPLAAAGLVAAWRSSRAGAFLLASCLAFDAFFSALVNPMGQAEKQTGCVSLFVLSVLAGQAVVALAGWGGRRLNGRGLEVLGPTGAALLSLLLLVGTWSAPAADGNHGPGAAALRAGRTCGLAYDIGLAALRQSPPEALLATGSDDLSALGLLLREVEHRRPDLAHVVKQMACDLPPGSLLSKSVPFLPVASDWRELVREECGVSPDLSSVARLWSRARERVDIGRGALQWELGDSGLDRLFEEVLIPGFPCFQTDAGEGRVGGRPRADLRVESFGTLRQTEEWDEFLAFYLAQFERLAGAALLRWQDRFVAGEAVELGCGLIASAVRRVPSDCPSWNNLGVCRSRAGDLEGALLAAGTAVDLCPDYFTGRVNFLRYALLLGRKDLARAQLLELQERYEPSQWQAALERLAGQLSLLPDQAPAAALESIR